MRNRVKGTLDIPKYKKVKEDSLGRMLFSSFFGMFVCMVCLVGLTMAWFTASVENTSDKFQTSNFVIVKNVEFIDDGSSVEQVGGWYSLEKDKGYTVILTGDSNFGMGSGYGVVILSSDDADGSNVVEYTTEAIKVSDADQIYNTVSFTITTNVSCKLKIGYGWGASGKEEVVHDGETVEFYSSIQAVRDEASSDLPSEDLSEPDETTEPASEETVGRNEDGTYTVKEGETLLQIALQFGTTAEKLAAYNGITDSDLAAGQILKIPPEDYEIPGVDQEESPSLDQEETPNVGQEDSGSEEPSEAIGTEAPVSENREDVSD